MLTLKILTDLVGIALFANWLLGWFTPLNSIRERLVGKMVNTMVRHNMLWAQPLLAVFTCPKCLTFWATLIYTKNFTYALIGSFIATLIHYILKTIGDVK